MFKMKACLLYLVAGLVVAACTDLSTKVEDAIGVDVSGGLTPPISDPAAALTSLYNQLRTMRGVTNTFALMKHTTDEMRGPTRGKGVRYASHRPKLVVNARESCGRVGNGRSRAAANV